MQRKKGNYNMKGKHKKWSETELNELSRLYKIDTAIIELSKIFNVERHNITTQLKRLNIYQDDRTRWTQENINKLKELAPNRNIREIATILHKSYTSINNACSKFNIKTRNSYEDWKQEEYDILKELCTRKATRNEILSKLPNRTKDSIRMKLAELGFIKQKRIWNDNNIQQLKELRNKNIEYQKISEILGLSLSAVSHKCQELGIQHEHAKRLENQQKLRQEGKKICFSCKQTKLLQEFSTNRSGKKMYHRPACKECEIEYTLICNKKQSLSIRINRKLRSAKKEITKRNLPFEIDEKFVMELLEKQNWKCYYSGIQMNYEHGNPLSFTLDRKDSNLGYTKENVVAACHFVNKAKMELSVNKFIDMCGKITENTKGWKI